MDQNEVLKLLQQYQSEGGSINAILPEINALASSGKTPLGLNQWQSSDKPVMKDFNDDNFLIDKYLRELMENKAAAGEPAEFELLPAVAGIGRIYYSKNPFHMVSVQLDIRLDGKLSGDITLAQLPAGYRPKRHVSAPCVVSRSDGVIVPEAIYFRSDGDIKLLDRASGAIFIHCLAFFLSAV